MLLPTTQLSLMLTSVIEPPASVPVARMPSPIAPGDFEARDRDVRAPDGQAREAGGRHPDPWVRVDRTGKASSRCP